MAIRSDYVTRATKFIKQFMPYIENCKTVRQYENATFKFNNQHKRCVSCQHGLTRVVFITSDYVVKITTRTDDIFGDCETEREFYEFAISEGKEYLFAPITRVEYNNHYYYIMPRINYVDTGKADVDYYLDPEDAYWVNEHLYDMHCGNFGFNKDKSYPIIIDYASVRSYSED